MKTVTINHMRVAVKLGMPSKDCKNHGICEIIMLKEIAASCALCIQALLTYEASSNRLQCKFLKDSISVIARQKHFTNGLFLIEEPYLLDERLQKAFNIENEHLIIARGYYVVKTTKRYLTVNFSLKTEEQTMKNIAMTQHFAYTQKQLAIRY
jgi:hypothetical protein